MMTIHVAGDLQTEQRCDFATIPARRDACSSRILCFDLGPQHLDNWDVKGLAPPFAKVHGTFPGRPPDSFCFTAIQWGLLLGWWPVLWPGRGDRGRVDYVSRPAPDWREAPLTKWVNGPTLAVARVLCEGIGGWAIDG
jgi:hypothetical protein